MQFAMLGPLLVADGDRVVRMPSARQRTLLAALLMQAGRAVSLDTLASAVWDTPSVRSADTLRTYVMRLRRTLGPQIGSRLVLRNPGYLLEATEDEVDVLRFTARCRDGATAIRAGAWQRASDVLTEALSLWRGGPLADIPSQALHRDDVPRLEHLHVQAREWRMDAELHLGRHNEIITDLREVAAEHPTREQIQGLLMLALYRCGRQAEALEVYLHVRAHLIAEVGVEPGPGLRDLHQRILAADPALIGHAPAGRPGPPTPPHPADEPAAGIHLRLAQDLQQDGGYAEALVHARQALDLYEHIDDRGGTARARNTIGWLHALLGDHDQALTSCRRALVLFQGTGDRTGEATAWTRLGDVYRLRRDPRATSCYQEARTLLDACGSTR